MQAQEGLQSEGLTYRPLRSGLVCSAVQRIEGEQKRAKEDACREGNGFSPRQTPPRRGVLWHNAVQRKPGCGAVLQGVGVRREDRLYDRRRETTGQ